MLNLGRHTLTGNLSTSGQTQHDWSADYRALQRWPIEQIWTHVQNATLTRSQGPWIVAVDDSITRKHGRHIPGCGWRRDPLSPPFSVNFVWGQRVLQFSAALPAKDGSARMVPIDWCEAPVPVKPKRNADAQQQADYREACRQANLNKVAVSRMAKLREITPRPIHFVGDGRFTNRTVLRHLPKDTVLIGRVRKDATLHALCVPRPGCNGRPRRYGDRLQTPEALRTDTATPWTRITAWACDRTHDFKVKTLGPVLSRMCGVDTPVRLVVIAPLAYRLRHAGKLLYRQPAYLLCTDPNLPLEQIVQAYLWRWGIEVNFRDEKTLLGVSEAQLRQPEAVRRQPSGVVAAYAMLLLAAHDAYGHDGLPPSVPLPKWRASSPPRRATTSLLLNQLRVELWSHCLRRESLSHFTSPPSPHQNPKKLNTSLASAVFHARN